MKRTLLLLSLAVAFIGSQASAQITVSSPSSPTVSPGAVFNVTIQLAVAQVLPTNVTALNLILATPTSGPNSGVGFFTVKFGSGTATFTTSTGNSTLSSSFDTPRASGANSGFTLSTTTAGHDLGVNAGGGAGMASPFAAITVETLQFTCLAGTPVGTYNFRAALDWPTDTGGSFINDSGNDGPSTGGTYAVTNAPIFTVTVVPEPSTWAFLTLGAAGCVGMVMIRRRRTA
jgi:hypothetical protein